MGQQSISFGVQQWQALYRSLGEENLGWGCNEPVTVSLTEGVYKFSCDEADRLYGILRGLDKSDGEKDGRILLDKALKFYKPKGFSGVYLKDGRVVPITAEVLSVQYDKKFEALLQYLGSEKIEVEINGRGPRVVDSSTPAFLRAIALEVFDNRWDREDLENIRQQFREAGIPTLYLSFKSREHVFGFNTSCVRIAPDDEISKQLGVPESDRYYYTLDLSQPRRLYLSPPRSEEEIAAMSAEALLLYGAIYDHLADQYGPAPTDPIFWAQLQRYLLEKNPNLDASEIAALEKVFRSPDSALRILDILVNSAHSQIRGDFYKSIYSTELMWPTLNVWRDLKDEKLPKIPADNTEFVFRSIYLIVNAINLGLRKEAVELRNLFFEYAEPEVIQAYEKFIGILRKIWGTLDRDPSFHNPLKE